MVLTIRQVFCWPLVRRGLIRLGRPVGRKSTPSAEQLATHWSASKKLFWFDRQPPNTNCSHRLLAILYQKRGRAPRHGPIALACEQRSTRSGLQVSTHSSREAKLFWLLWQPPNRNVSQSLVFWLKYQRMCMARHGPALAASEQMSAKNVVDCGLGGCLSNTDHSFKLSLTLIGKSTA